MPEGHLAHHYAREHERGLTGTVRASSPQGRFAGEAAMIDGCRIDGVEAYGKHLFYAWEEGSVVNVHLGLLGLFVHHPVPPPEARGQVRLRMAGATLAVDLIAPARCELTDAEGRDRAVARLGPDPLRAEADPERAWERLHRSRAPIGALLLDQSIVAGLGNVLRAEVLHLVGIHPMRPGRLVTRAEFDQLWDVLVDTMRRAVTAARITTVEPPPGADPRDLPDTALRRVYKRYTCSDCGSPVDRWSLAGRETYACSVCQPPPARQEHATLR